MSPDGNSSTVRSTQDSIHPDLLDTVDRYERSVYRRPLSSHAGAAFKTVEDFVTNRDRPLIVDSGCGTGESSLMLAARHPDHTVLGIDKSEKRLEKGRRRSHPENCLLIRADLVDLWRLLVTAGWPVERHYLLYPNPWPKPKHLTRRWHAHPVFPVMLRLAATLELRTNWAIYAQEFFAATEYLRPGAAHFETIEGETPISPFERKYAASGHTLFKVIVTA